MWEMSKGFVLVNLKELINDMRLKNIVVCVFPFLYKSIGYSVLVSRFTDKHKKTDRYALAKLVFIKNGFEHDTESWEANSMKILIPDIGKFRRFFGIEYSLNLGNIIEQFSSFVNKSIPSAVPMDFTRSDKKIMVDYLSRCDSEDPNKIYCYSLKRNATGNYRTEYNTNKALLLRNELYQRFKEDNTISFCFSADARDEKSDEEIIENFYYK